MSVDVAPRARAEVAWPEFLVPAAAVAAWLRLQAALQVVTSVPPCEAEPEAWFAGPSQRRRIEEAVAGCRSCPVLHLCRSYALAAGESSGVWGATTEAERRAGRGRR